MMNSQRIDTEKIDLIEEGKKIGIDEAVKHNEIIKKEFKLLNIKSRHLIV